MTGNCGVVARLISADATLATHLNTLVRQSGIGRPVAAGAATWLASIEVCLMGALALAGRRRAALRMLAAVGLVYSGSEVLGRLWPRRRPFSVLSDVEPLVAHTAQRSFPSRHVASGLAMAAIGR